MHQRHPIVVDGARYNPVKKWDCEGCAAGRPDSLLCQNLQSVSLKVHPSACSNREGYPSVIWLTDADYAVHRLTQGEST